MKRTKKELAELWNSFDEETKMGFTCVAECIEEASTSAYKRGFKRGVIFAGLVAAGTMAYRYCKKTTQDHATVTFTETENDAEKSE